MELSTFVITTKGQALMAKLLQGTGTANFTAIKLSSTAYSQEQLVNLTSLTNIKQSAAITNKQIVSVTHIQIEAALDNTALASGYNINTIGIYAIDPDEGEILYAVTRAIQAGYMPAYNGITVSGATFKFVISVGNSSNVTVTVDPAGYASMSDIHRLDADIIDIKGYIGMVDDDIYGVEVDFQNRTFKRVGGAEGKTYGADFDNLDPWKRKRCIVTDAGVILAYYGEAGYTESGALTQALIIDEVTYAVGTKVQVMVYQPKFYYRVVPIVTDKILNGKGSHLRKARYYVSPVMRDGFKLHPAFKYNGIEQDYILLSAYEGCLYDVSASAYILNDSQVADFTASTGDKLSSIANAKPISGLTQDLTRAKARILASNRGTGWQLQDVNKVSATQLLFLVEYASFNSQSQIGNGNVSKTDDGSTNMSETTGTTTNLGNDSGVAVNTGGYQSVSYRGEENLWGNIWKWIDGANIKANASGLPQDLFIADHGFADATYSGVYADAEFSIAPAGGYANAMGYSESHDYLFFASETGHDASSSLPVGDYFWVSTTAGDRVARLGADWGGGVNAGLFDWRVTDAPSHRYRGIGGRLAYVPKTT